MLRIHFGSTGKSHILGRGHFDKGGGWKEVLHGISQAFIYIILATFEGVGSNCSFYTLFSQVALNNLLLEIQISHLRIKDPEFFRILENLGNKQDGHSEKQVCCPTQLAFAEVGMQQLNRTSSLSYQALKMASFGSPSLSWQIFYTREGRSTRRSLRILSTPLVTFPSKMPPWSDEGPK